MSQNKQVVSLRPDNIIDEEASRWLAKLDGGQLSTEESKTFKQWLAKDARHAAALKAMADIWYELDGLLNDAHEVPLTAKLLSRISQKTKPLLAFAASVLLVLTIVLLAPMFNVDKAHFRTAIGQQLEAQLADGSSIHLNTNSIIETEFSSDKRIIRLIRGEALFDVAHDINRPFIVYAGNRQVQALGTKFVVHLANEQVQVTVTDGKVKLSQLDNAGIAKDDALIVAKGEQALAIKAEPANLSKVSLSQVNNDDLSWIDGNLVFNNETLSQVLTEINRYVAEEVVLADEQLKNIRVSGRFDLGDTQALVEALELSLNLTAKRLEDNKIVLVKSNQ